MKGFRGYRTLLCGRGMNFCELKRHFAVRCLARVGRDKGCEVNATFRSIITMEVRSVITYKDVSCALY